MSYDYLEHHGILGQKWGVRRFQNKDGSYTDAGKRHRESGIAPRSNTDVYDNAIKGNPNKTRRQADIEARRGINGTHAAKYEKGKRIRDKKNDKTVAKFETSLKNYWEASVDNANDMRRASKNIVIVNKDKQALVDKALKEVDALGYKMNKEFEWADTGSYHVKEGKAYVSYMLRSSTGKIYMKDIKLDTKPNSEFETIKSK